MHLHAAPSRAFFDDRYSRQAAIQGWSQDVLAAAHVLVAGAGALGNEVLKNLALLGVGHVTIVDRDVVEVSNLSRAVLFREGDVGEPKVVCAARRLRELNHDIEVVPLHADVTHAVGAGLLARHGLVLGCLDSIEARWRLNRLCREARVPWIDAGIDATIGQISYFAAGSGACYECGMTEAMWLRLGEQRSCQLAQRAVPERQVATTAAMASLLAALQVQEALAQLHVTQLSHARVGTPDISNDGGWHVLRAGGRVSVSVVPYAMTVLHGKVREDCLAHTGDAEDSVPLAVEPGELTLSGLLQATRAEVLTLDWDVAAELICPRGCQSEPCCLPSWRVREDMLPCPWCGSQRRLEWQSSISGQTALGSRTLAELGVPQFAVLHLVTNEGRPLRVELTGAPAVRE